ncbi:kelch-like protein 28 [Saccoglossus kowalevskii]|uniref:Kelch-like protein 28-like n=1 Tax=Saccoglossus kowalevskii TaxID=10224 RepID=A0ABM0GZH8_SACKO|nr:PREDICTED: kelch-like protein 28-like [Saccoglossus kowalevskii]
MDLTEDAHNANSVVCIGELELYSEHLLHGLNELRQREELCDVVLRIGDTKIRAHRAVLASCSPYFKAMFTGNMCEREKEEIEFKSIDESAMKLLVDFAYTGKVHVSQVTVQSLLPAADLLQLKSVTKKCCDFLEGQLHPNNCIGIAKFAETHACCGLYRKAYTYIFQHFEDVIETIEFCQLEGSEVAELLSSDDLNVKSEKSVFHALKTWIKYDINKRRCYLSRLLPSVRLPLLTVKFLTQSYEADQLIRDDYTCQELVNKALKYHLVAEERLRVSPQMERSIRPRREPKVICAVGGKNGLFATLDSLEVYLPQNDSWTEVAPLSCRRYECVCAVLDRKLYVIGGMKCIVRGGTSIRHHDNSVDRWNADSDTWTNIGGMIKCRSNLAVAVLEGELYALGGYNGETYLRSVEKFCPRTMQWRLVAPMLKSRSCFAAAVLDGMIYAVGGYGPTYLNSVERYDPSHDRWEMVAPMVEKRINFGVGVSRGFLYVVGGHNGVSHLSSVERYDPHRNEWVLVAPMDKPRTGLGVAVLDHKLYVVGGHSGSSYLNIVQCYNPISEKWSTVNSMSTCRCNFGLAAL